MKQKMKMIRTIFSILIGILILVGICFGFDLYRTQEGKAPLFCLKLVGNKKKEEGVQEYIGLGYKVIRFNQLVGWKRGDTEYYKQNKIGTWLMKKEDFSFEIEEAKRKLDQENNQYVPLAELPYEYNTEQAVLDGCLVLTEEGVYHSNELEEFESFVNLEQRMVLRIVEIEKDAFIRIQDITYLPEEKEFQIQTDDTRNTKVSEKERRISEIQTYSQKEFDIKIQMEEKEDIVLALFRKKGGEEVFEKEQEIARFAMEKMVSYSKYQNLEATIQLVSKKELIVEPKENSPICKVAKKFCIKREAWDYKKYNVGEKVQITFNRINKNREIPELEGARINQKNYEIQFIEEESEEDRKLHLILSQKEGYPYNVYTYQGLANIRINGKEMELETALKKNISIEELLEKAQEDTENEQIKAITLKDGGTTLYYYDNCTIVKYHTLDGKEDVYIAKPNLDLSELLQ